MFGSIVDMVFLAALAVIPEPTQVERNGGETPAQTFAALTSRVDCVTDPKSYPGCRHGVNFVSVLPYYDGN